MPKNTAPKTRIRHFRLGKGLTLQQLADKAGVSMGTLWKLEMASTYKEVNKTGLQTLFALSRALKVTLADLYPRVGQV